jgi:hypothetical protein
MIHFLQRWISFQNKPKSIQDFKRIIHNILNRKNPIGNEHLWDPYRNVQFSKVFHNHSLFKVRKGSAENHPAARSSFMSSNPNWVHEDPNESIIIELGV